MTGHPALTLPAGFAADGLPLAVQLIGPWHADDRLLALAATLEQARPWAGRTPQDRWQAGTDAPIVPGEPIVPGTFAIKIVAKVPGTIAQRLIRTIRISGTTARQVNM